MLILFLTPFICLGYGKAKISKAHNFSFCNLFTELHYKAMNLGGSSDD